MMKKLASIMLIFALISCLVACSGNSEDAIALDPATNSSMTPYMVDEPINPLAEVDLAESVVYIHRYGYGNITEPILMDDTDTTNFISCLENADMDSTPTIDENDILSTYNPTYTITLRNGEEHIISLISPYIVIDSVKYIIDSESSEILSTYYVSVMLEDGKRYYVSVVEYDYVSGNINDEGYESAKKGLVENGIIESEDEYYEILSGIDDVTDYVVPSS